MKHTTNAIIIMVDQMKATASHLYSRYGVKTPNIERLGSMGVRYENATTPHPLCVPARTAMWTARNPHKTGSLSNKFPLSQGMDHAAKWWKKAGYELALIGKNHCFQDQQERDFFDVWCEIEHFGLRDRFPDPSSPRGMDWVEEEYLVTEAHAVRNNMPPSDGGSVGHAVTDFEHKHYSSGLLARQADAYIREQLNPFVLWLSFPDPHVPYEVPREYYERVKAQNIELPPMGPPPGEESPERNRVLSKMMRWPDDKIDDLQELVTCYLASILHIDDAIGQVLDTLEDTDKINETAIIFCSDHGDFSGEHQMASKGGVFYDCLVRVPMLLAAPGAIEPSQVVNSPVCLTDVIPTLFSLQNLDTPRGLDGQPMVPCPGAVAKEYGFSLYGAGGPDVSLNELRELDNSYGRQALLKTGQKREAAGRRSMIRGQRWKYVHDSMGDLDELYDLQVDPFEHRNLAGQPDYSQIQTKLHNDLADWRRWDKQDKKNVATTSGANPEKGRDVN